MKKAIINKHIDNSLEGNKRNYFVDDLELAKGEILISNDSNNPSIFIVNNDNEVVKISSPGSSGGGSYDDTDIRSLIAQNTQAIEKLSENGVGATIPNKIVVAGLDGQFGSGYYKNYDEIPEGTNIYEILQNILSKEIYPSSVNGKEATATAAMNDLQLKLNISGTVEVGTEATLLEAATNGSFVTTTPSKITGMSYGYSESNDDTRDSMNSTITSECHTEVANNTYILEAVIDNGFGTTVQTPLVAKENTGNVSLDETKIGDVSEGSNQITINATGASYTYQANQINKIYYCSNLGKTDASKYHNGVTAVEGVTNRAVGTASVNITGSYYYFMGYSPNISFENFDSTSIRELNVQQDWVNQNGDTIVVPNGTNITSNGQSIVIACPVHYKLKSINYSNQADMLSKFTSAGVITVRTGEIDSEYNVYVYPISNNTPVEFTNVVIGKV